MKSSISPAAQAVMIAATNGNINVVNDPVYKQCIAAALRALCRTSTDEAMVRGWVCKVLTTEDILAIAAELEGHDG